ncbi:MAG: nucleoside deaminase [bacterium]|nr:nucleoside deaminase [bacterium]
MSKQFLTPPIQMPDWAVAFETEALNKPFYGDEEKIRFAIQLAIENVRHGTGGPFGAAIFDSKTDHLIAIGINSVVPAKQSWAHAEMTAYARAQHRLGTYHLQGCLIATSCEPCAMCCGATPWSGIECMLYGATKADAEAVGFDEGDKGEAWVEALQKRSIDVRGPILHEEAKVPFIHYRECTGKIY